MKKKIILSVTNDLTSEQRVHKVCLSLLNFGFDVELVGRKRRKSLPLGERPYATKRMALLFEKGPLFYAEYNIRLFLYLIFRRADVLVANDLDTLLANYMASLFKGSSLVHDSHEYFTGVPELAGRGFAHTVWKRIERWIFPKLRHVYTVNDSIAKLYRDEYGTGVKVVRNFPLTGFAVPGSSASVHPAGKPVILYQGSVNLDRGLLEAVEAMPFVENATLMIVGDGDVLDQVRSRAEALKLGDKVKFVQKVPFEQLRRLTEQASIGISLDRDTNLNYRYSLPNKIFDYAGAGLPVLASALPEIRKVFAKYEIGLLAESHDPEYLAGLMNTMLRDESRRKTWKENCKLAMKEYCWENEESVLREIYCTFV